MGVANSLQNIEERQSMSRGGLMLVEWYKTYANGIMFTWYWQYRQKWVFLRGVALRSMLCPKMKNTRLVARYLRVRYK